MEMNVERDAEEGLMLNEGDITNEEDEC